MKFLSSTVRAWPQFVKPLQQGLRRKRFQYAGFFPRFNRIDAFKNRILQYKIKSFVPKLQFSFDYKHFRVRTAQTYEDLRAVLELRYEVFICEELASSNQLGLDLDRYDLRGDHIMVEDLNTGQVIGTYRLLCSRFTDQFYSETEFDLRSLQQQLDGILLELGRACIHRDYRNGITLNLIWRGLAKYATLSGADFMFGCASVKTMSADLGHVLFTTLRDQSHPTVEVKPWPKYQLPSPSEHHSICADEPLSALPSLFRSYLKMGAKVCGPPALDREFQCIDFLLLLELKSLTEKYNAKYLKDMAPAEPAANNESRTDGALEAD